jgi:phosphohistidine phosphatase
MDSIDTERPHPAAKKATPPAKPRNLKTLSLIRHAKSSWEFPGLEDVDRPLNARGRREAALMARALAERGFTPDLWISSTALRAFRTAEILAAAVDWPVSKITLENGLYHPNTDELLTLLRRLEPAAAWVACVGHDPELTDLARLLSKADIVKVPTCGIVEMRFAIDGWEQLGQGKPLSFLIDFPKNHL